MSTTINWPTLFRKRSAWLEWFSSVEPPEDIIEALLFDFSDKNGDVALTPVVPLDQEYLAVVPSIVLRANLPRNAFVLLAHKFNAAYSRYTASKEAKLLADIATRFPQFVIGTAIHLPSHKGRQLPDIDLLLREPGGRRIVVGEVKWQLSGSDVREVIARNDYLKKGAVQLCRIRAFFEEDPGYLVRRGLLNSPISADTADYVLLCKGHLGNEDVLVPGIAMGDYDTFFEFLSQCGLESAVRKVQSFDYLPVIGRDFILQDMPVKYNDWIIWWKQRGHPNLPPDNETDALDRLYRKTSNHLDIPGLRKGRRIPLD